MYLTTFEPTRFGRWIVKLSHINKDDLAMFLVVAYNPMNEDIIVKTFECEIEVVNFVNFLGEKYE